MCTRVMNNELGDGWTGTGVVYIHYVLHHIGSNIHKLKY